MNCQEALNLLYDIIDKEASEIDARQVEEHLEKCSDCFQKYRLETEIQNFLNEKIRKGKIEVVHETLKTRILDSLDAIDRAEDASDQGAAKARENPRPFRFAATGLVAAASVLFLVGAGLFGFRFYSHQTKFVPLEQSHWTMTAAVQAGSANNAASMAAEARERFGYSLEPIIDGLELVAGQPEVILGADVLHFVYADGERAVSVFLAPAAWFEKVNDRRLREVVHSDIHFFDHNCRGCRVVFHRHGATLIITASSDRSVDLLEFVPGHEVI